MISGELFHWTCSPILLRPGVAKGGGQVSVGVGDGRGRSLVGVGRRGVGVGVDVAVVACGVTIERQIKGNSMRWPVGEAEGEGIEGLTAGVGVSCKSPSRRRPCQRKPIQTNSASTPANPSPISTAFNAVLRRCSFKALNLRSVQRAIHARFYVDKGVIHLLKGFDRRTHTMA